MFHKCLKVYFEYGCKCYFDSIYKIRYPGLLDPTQIVNLLKWSISATACSIIPPPIEEDLKILKVEYLSNRQILNLSLYDQITNPLKEDNLQWKTTSKY